MKVAIDSGPLTSGHSVRGVGLYTRELIKAPEESPAKLKDLKIVPVDFLKEDLSKFDVVHYTHFNPYVFSIPRNANSKTIVTIHDLIPLVYPKQYQPGIKGKLRFLIQKLLIRNVGAIITDSETSKKDIVRFLNVNSSKIYVVRLAAGIGAKKITDRNSLKQVARKYKLPNKFIFYLGDVNYNKNIPNLVTAARLARLPLVIAGKEALDIEQKAITLKNLSGPQDWVRFLMGKSHPELKHLDTLSEELSQNPNVIRIGFISDEDLIAVFNLAAVYVQPSFYEGFGFPVLQAMASDTPVVIARNNALVELAGGAALSADPDNPKDMAKKINQVVEDTTLRIRLIKGGSERAKKFSWNATAKETMEIYRKVAGK